MVVINNYQYRYVQEEGQQKAAEPVEEQKEEIFCRPAIERACNCENDN